MVVTTIFVKEWERPELPDLARRLAKAQRYYQVFYAQLLQSYMVLKNPQLPTRSQIYSLLLKNEQF